MEFLLVAKREVVVKLDGWTLQCYSDINHTLIGRLQMWRDKNGGVLIAEAKCAVSVYEIGSVLEYHGN